VFVRAGGVWTQQQKLTSSDAAAGDIFGYSVSVSGNTVVVGARHNDDAGTDSGSAYMFQCSGACCDEANGVCTDDVIEIDCEASGGRYGGHGSDCATIDSPCGQCAEEQKLTASDAAGGDQFGWSVSVSGGTALVGAYFDSHGGGANAGSAHPFVRTGNVWTPQGQLSAGSDAAASDFFGYSVSVSGNTAVVGAYANDDAGSASGSAYAFNNSGSAYVFECASCSPPDCNSHGTCANGTCLCDTGFAGGACDQCAPNHYNYPTCTFCQAATTCSGNGTCNALGECDCDPGFLDSTPPRAQPPQGPLRARSTQ